MLRARRELEVDEWVKALNRINARPDLPITLQGGEPTFYPGFYDVVEIVDKPMDLLTNLQFDIEEFTARVKPNKFKREAPYASIRVSYHPETMSIYQTINDVILLLSMGYQVGIWMVDHPRYENIKEAMAFACIQAGIDFRTKEFLGVYEGKLYGRYKYPDAVGADEWKKVMCKPSELLVAPDGDVHRCHSDLYEGRNAYGNILDEGVKALSKYKECSLYGNCNPCDIKLKTNRFQQFGHCSVKVKEER